MRHLATALTLLGLTGVARAGAPLPGDPFQQITGPPEVPAGAPVIPKDFAVTSAMGTRPRVESPLQVTPTFAKWTCPTCKIDGTYCEAYGRPIYSADMCVAYGGTASGTDCYMPCYWSTPSVPNMKDGDLYFVGWVDGSDTPTNAAQKCAIAVPNTPHMWSCRANQYNACTYALEQTSYHYPSGENEVGVSGIKAGAGAIFSFKDVSYHPGTGWTVQNGLSEKFASLSYPIPLGRRIRPLSCNPLATKNDTIYKDPWTLGIQGYEYRAYSHGKGLGKAPVDTYLENTHCSQAMADTLDFNFAEGHHYNNYTAAEAGPLAQCIWSQTYAACRNRADGEPLPGWLTIAAGGVGQALFGPVGAVAFALLLAPLVKNEVCENVADQAMNVMYNDPDSDNSDTWKRQARDIFYVSSPPHILTLMTNQAKACGTETPTVTRGPTVP